MSEPRKDYAVYNLERTIVGFPVTRILENMVQLELLPDMSLGSIQAQGMSLQRELMLKGMRNREPAEIKPLLDITKREVPQQIVRWAALLMERHAQVNRTIAVYSAAMPQPFVHAYAVGLRALLPPGTTTEAYGKPTILRHGRLSGELGEMHKAETLEQLQHDGHTIAFVADSFGTSIPAVKIAEYGLLANFRSHRQSPEYDHITWADSRQNFINAQGADSKQVHRYDLDLESGRTALLDWLTRKDPTAQI